MPSPHSVDPLFFVILIPGRNISYITIVPTAPTMYQTRTMNIRFSINMMVMMIMMTEMKRRKKE